ncbi:sulfate respiration complex hexadecaheme cytochrome HmcA [Pseudodesulfovibrio sp. zrk46]|uniref:sulfate respiration complex hexadecaheme cytochrome HmcA n=1 Tax=Pseudodesulfovibrio sp. zrk46 TaxID=2725288 RepID=UPI001448C54D|nr:cytochrome c3 family protein [Pseudodesulfovibrio sp. zrk46]QJB56851.1 cytochrome c3 family protein [Pseudodesulfovibrio sp. zrk46]
MEKGRRLLFWAGILFVFAATSIVCLEAQGLEAQAKAASEARVDIVKIDTLAKFEKLELPEVTFYHDQHTDALAKQGKDCASCHEKDADGKLSIKFKRLADDDADKIKLIYHENCIGCHQDMVAAGQKTGPLDGQCRSCHTAKPTESDWMAIDMDKSLHYRHVVASGGDDKCQTCHHQFDKNKMELVADKGKEQNCRNCHGAEPRVVNEKLTVRSYDEAAHAKCVTCHVDVTAAKKNSGPAKCAGCHAAADQAKIKEFKDVPRLKRGQPDVTLLVAVKNDKAQANIGPVPFDHKAHEQYMDDCRACHVGKGTMDGKFFELAGDMHLKSNMEGCIGCHTAKQEEKAVCAGCHAMMAETKAPSKESCAKCHVESLATLYVDGKAPEKEVMMAAASSALAERNMEVMTIADSDIPEEVIIGSLSDKFEASKLPHRKIVKRLLADMKGDKMAGYFHGQDALMCAGCHHNSPISKTPPKCGSCHNKPFDPARPDMPGLKAAYHGQCMGCHTAMKLEKPSNTTCNDAEGCHKKK